MTRLSSYVPIGTVSCCSFALLNNCQRDDAIHDGRLTKMIHAGDSEIFQKLQVILTELTITWFVINDNVAADDKLVQRRSERYASQESKHGSFFDTEIVFVSFVFGQIVDHQRIVAGGAKQLAKLHP